jgi:hypothetical protein
LAPAGHTKPLDRRPNSLLASEISLGRLNRNVPQKELNLFQLSSASLAQLGTSSTEVMRSQLCHADSFRAFLHNMPDCFFRHAVAPDSAHFGHFSKDPSPDNLGSREPAHLN